MQDVDCVSGSDLIVIMQADLRRNYDVVTVMLNVCAGNGRPGETEGGLQCHDFVMLGLLQLECSPEWHSA